MRFDGFIGGSYENRAITADVEKTVNWFVEGLQSKAATSQRILLPTPGVETIVSIPTDSPGRAHFAIPGREFAVLGAYFYEFGRSGNVLTSTTRYGEMFLQGPTAIANGLLPNTSQPATICRNGDGGGQLFITSGGNGYIFDLTANTLNKIAALDGKAHFGGHLDGYFLALDTDTSTLYVSALYDGTTWDTGGTFAKRSLGPDKWKSMKIAGRAAWLYGEETTEVWYNTGDRFPLSPLANQLIGYGIAAPFSAETLGDDIYWLSLNRDGKVCVVKASGLQPQTISTFPLDSKMQSYLSLNNAVADSYSDAGHSFYLINFDNDGVTHCWDSASETWHERGTWLPEENRYTSWRPRFYAYAFGEHRMLDASNGNLYRMSADLVRDVDGRMIRRMRRAPALSNENKRVFYSELELDLEPGVGVDHGIVGFTMEAQVAVVSGTVTYGGDPVPDAEIIVTVDGEDWPIEVTTDENGEYEIDGVPAGEVVVTATAIVGGIPLCGSATDTNSPPTPLVLDPTLAVYDPNWCAVAVEVGAPALFDVQFTPDLVGSSCNSGLTYFWKFWNNATSEESPAATSTEQSPFLESIFSEGSQAKLWVTHTATGHVVSSPAEDWTAGEMQCPP
jgi:hypothetical protein